MKKFLLISFFVLILLTSVYFRIAYSNEISKDLMDTARGIASFIFGALFAYYLGNSRDKHKLITGTLRKDDYLLTTIYMQSKVFGEQVQIRIKELLDNYLTSQVDYYLEDFRQTNKEFKVLYNYILNIPTTNNKEELFAKNMFSAINFSTENRKIIESATGNKITEKEWFTLFIFATIILLSTIGLYNGSFESFIITLLLSGGILTLLYLLYQIDGLNWRRDDFLWVPLSNLFREFDLLPYFPKNLINKSKYKKIGGNVRAVTYPNPYPDFRNKSVEIINLDK